MSTETLTLASQRSAPLTIEPFPRFERKHFFYFSKLLEMSLFAKKRANTLRPSKCKQEFPFHFCAFDVFTRKVTEKLSGRRSSEKNKSRQDGCQRFVEIWRHSQVSLSATNEISLLKNKNREFPFEFCCLFYPN